MENNKIAEQYLRETYKLVDFNGLTLNGKSWLEIMEEYHAFRSQPLSKVGEVTEEKVYEMLHLRYQKVYSETKPGQAYPILPDKWVIDFFRSLLQPQPVNSEGKEEDFEKFPELTEYIKEMANTGKVPNEWSNFLIVLNKAVSSEGKKELVGNFCQASKVSNGFNDEQPTFEQGKKEGVKYFAENNQYWREMRFNGQIIKSEITKKEFVELINCLESDTVVEQGEAKEPTDFKLDELFIRYGVEDPASLIEELRPLFRSSEVKEQGGDVSDLLLKAIDAWNNLTAEIDLPDDITDIDFKNAEKIFLEIGKKAPQAIAEQIKKNNKNKGWRLRHND